MIYERVVEQFPTSGRYWRLFIEQEVNFAWISKCRASYTCRFTGLSATLVVGSSLGVLVFLLVLGLHVASVERGLFSACCAVLAMLSPICKLCGNELIGPPLRYLSLSKK